MELFKRGTEIAAGRGLILVDTKYEFGHRDGKIYLIDEIHTPDSSVISIQKVTKTVSPKVNRRNSCLKNSFAND